MILQMKFSQGWLLFPKEENIIGAFWMISTASSFNSKFSFDSMADGFSGFDMPNRWYYVSLVLGDRNRIFQSF